MDTKKIGSLRLAQFFVCCFMLALVVICLGAPKFVPWFAALRGAPLTGREPLLLASIYLSVPPAAWVLWLLHRLLGRIRRGQVFTRENAASLGRISVCCMIAAVIFALSALYYPSFWMLAVTAALVSLMLGVLHTVFAQAVDIKEENDLTV